MGGPVTNLSTVAQVSAEVDRVTADIADEEIEGSVTNGVVLFWVPGTFTVQQVDEAVFTAFDADGDVIDASPR
jgi:DNA-binding protein YbaB